MPTTPRRIDYGSDADQYGLLALPADRTGGRRGGLRPVVVLIHGGFWRARYGLDLMTDLAEDLVARGYVVWNVEYRRVGQPGGGYPGTLDDVAAAMDALGGLAGEHGLDLARVAVVGHSAGGHLGLWAADRSEGVIPAVAVGLAGVVDLVEAARARLGDDGRAVSDFLGGGPDDEPEAYRGAQPALDGDRVVLVHGTGDDVVPPSQSIDGAERSGADLILVDGADHFDVIDPASEAWARVVAVLDDRLRP